MKKPRNREDQANQEDLLDGNEFQNNESGRNGQPEERSGDGRYGRNEDRDQQGERGDGKSERHGSYNNYDELDENENDQQGEGEDEQEGGYEYADQENGKAGKSDKFDIKKIAQKVKDYMKGDSESLNQETIVKYASVAIVAIYGIRKGGLIGGLLLSAAVGLVTKYLLDEQGQGQEQGQETEAQAA